MWFYSRSDGYWKPIRRSHRVILFVYDRLYNDDADLEVSDTCVRNSLLSWVDEMLVWLSVWSMVGADCLHMVQLMPLHPRTPSSLASFKSRMILPFWYRLTQVVPEKRPLNVCSSSCKMTWRLCRSRWRLRWLNLQIRATILPWTDSCDAPV